MRTARQIKIADEEVPMESRIARLESDVSHIQKDVADLKTDLRNLRDKLDSLRDRFDAFVVETERAFAKLQVSMVETRVWSLLTIGGILLLMARAFKWI